MTSEHFTDFFDACPREELAEWAVDVSKTVYGIKMRHMYDWEKEQLKDFILSIYDWNVETQRFDFKDWVNEQIAQEDAFWDDEVAARYEEEDNAWLKMCEGE